jgi:tetratricopeptide (TPR) repeat protein
LGRPDAPAAVEALRQAESRAKDLRTRIPPTQWAPVLFDLGLIYERLGEPAEAQHYYAEAVEEFGATDVSAYVALIGLARAQQAAGEVSAAEQTLEKARNLDPQSPWAYLELAHVRKDEPRRAEAALDKASEVASNEAYVEIVRAELCQSWERFECAADAYAQALQMRPNSGWLHSLVGDFYRPTDPLRPHQNWETAAKHYRRAAELRPRDPWAHERLAYVLLNQGAYSESAQEYQQAIELTYQKEAPAGLYCNLGVAQERAGTPAEALTSYRRCAELATDDEQRAQAEAGIERLTQ